MMNIYLISSFRCRPGFTLEPLSKNAVGTHVQLTCKEDGKWVADSKCVRIKCPELSLFASLVYNCSDTINYGSICSTVCPNDEVLVLFSSISIDSSFFIS